jgi:hypothetical protein
MATRKKLSVLLALLATLGLIAVGFLLLGSRSVRATGRIGSDCVAVPSPIAAVTPTISVGNHDAPSQTPAPLAPEDIGRAAGELHSRDPGYLDESEEEWARLSEQDTEQRLETLREYSTELSDFRDRFTGKRIVGWQGWIANISPGLYRREKDVYDIAVYIADPYLSAPAPSANDLDDLWPYHYISLCCLNPTDARSLAIGQEVLFCGEIWDIRAMLDGKIIVNANTPIINPMPLEDNSVAEPIPGDFLIRYEARGCGDGYACPDYSVTIDGQGGVVYEGYAHAPAIGTRITRIDEAKLKQLVTLLRRARYFELEDFPSSIPGNPKGSTQISVTMDGKTKTVAWRWESNSTPGKLHMISSAVNHVTHVWPWIRIWPDVGD